MPRWSLADLIRFNERQQKAIPPDPAGEVAKPKRRVSCEPKKPVAHEEGDQTKILVRVEQVRKRLLDEDNLFSKIAVDCLRRTWDNEHNCFLIPDDSPKYVHIQNLQRKPVGDEPEHVIIDIIYNYENETQHQATQTSQGNDPEAAKTVRDG